MTGRLHSKKAQRRERLTAGGVREGFLEKVVLELSLKEKAVAVKFGEGSR